MPHNPMSESSAPLHAASVLVADADAESARPLVAYLGNRGYRVQWADTGEKAHNLLDAQPFDVLVTELLIGRHEGMRLMNVARDRTPEVCTIIVTDPPQVARAMEAMRAGAYDVQTKPLNLEKVDAVIERGIKVQQLLYEQHQLKRRLDEQYGLTSLIGQSRPMTLVYNTLRQSASTLAPIVLSGEPGTGKDLAAQAIHNTSVRRNGPFVKLDCRAGTSASIERELLGAPAAAGETAYTGRIELADGGTLYLDHAEALPDALWVLVTGVVKTGRFTRPSDTRAVHSDIRLVVSIESAHRSDSKVNALRESMNAIHVDLPPLRERREDLPLLLDYFLAEAARRHRKPVPAVSWDALEVLQRYAWPGNVRELRACAEAMAYAAKADRAITLTAVPREIREAADTAAGDLIIPAGATMKEVERIVIEETMRAAGNDKEACAKRLGIGLRTLYRKLKEYESA
jgi:two-component system response regulator HydG